MMESCEQKPKGEFILSILQRNPNWLDLPTDLTKNILQRLSTVDLVTVVRLVCTQWWKICKDPLMWRTINITDNQLNNRRNSFHSSEKICRSAIDFSCGFAEDIAIEYIGTVTDDLLKYMSHRVRRLRRLRISACSGFYSNERLNEYVKKFSQLEELEISFDSRKISGEGLKEYVKKFIEDIGRCCPLLKSLNLNIVNQTQYVKGVAAWNSYFHFAYQFFAIAKTMSGLRHLALSGIWFGDDELLSILKGCPLLDSLDLQDCSCPNQLSPSLVKRCNEQIKDLKLPT